MSTPGVTRPSLLIPVVLTVFFGFSRGAYAYIDGAPEALTVPRLILEFRSIAVLQVERIDLEKGAILFKHVEQSQGRAHFEKTRHAIRYNDAVPAEFKNLKPGDRAIFFSADGYGRGVTLIDGGWYCSVNYDKRFEWWTMAYTAGHYDFNCAYTGSVAELIDTVKELLRGEEVVVKCRKKRQKPDTQYVRYTLRDAAKKEVVSGPGAPAAKPERPLTGTAQLAKALQDNKVRARVVAAEALAQLGPEARSAEPVLTMALRSDKDPFVRRSAAIALGAIGPDAKEAVPVLIERLQSHYENIDGLIGAECSAALGRIDPDGRIAVALLIPRLKEANASVKMQAAGQLAMIGAPVRSAAPALIEAFNDKSVDVRYAVASALWNIRPDPMIAVPAFMAALKDPHPYVRTIAARALGDIGPDAKAAISALQEATKDKDADVRQHAKESLQQIMGK